VSYKQHFSRFFASAPKGKLHFAAHSHHYWPDVSFEAHKQAWLDAAASADDKWGKIMETVFPEAQGHIARVLGLPDPRSIAFAPNTHELVVRLCSCIERAPVRVLTTGSEFLSFARQSARFEEAGQMQVTRIPTEPFESFADRFLEAARGGGYDLVYVSNVFYDSGFVFDRLTDLADAVRDDECLIAIDGYHSFLAVPTDLGPVAERMFFLAGGYKYAMSGEGVCFMHCPPGYGERPVNTGWFAGFGALTGASGTDVAYSAGGFRFQGATIDVTPIYRMNAVMRLLADLGLTVEAIHAHVAKLQHRAIDRLTAHPLASLPIGSLLPPAEIEQRGHFLTFRTDRAEQLQARLAELGVATDYRRDRLRFGFAIYHDEADVDALAGRLAQL